MTGMLAAWIRSRHPQTRLWGAALSVIAVATVIAALLAVPPAPAQAAITAETADEAPTDTTLTAETPEVGSTRTFWALDWSTQSYGLRLAKAEYVGEHVVVYLEEGSELSDYSLNELGVAFDQVIYPTLTEAYGSEPDPGIDGESRIAILIYDFRDPMNDIDGLFNSWDVDPDGSPYSNHSEMFYLNVNALHAVAGSAPAIAAHEFSHLLVYCQDVLLDPSAGALPESSWLAEGFSTYAEHLCGYDQRVNSWLRSFADDPDFDLTRWEGFRSNYGASYSFMSYLAEREGPAFVRALVRQTLDGIDGIDGDVGRRRFGLDVRVALRRLGAERLPRFVRPAAAALPVHDLQRLHGQGGALGSGALLAHRRRSRPSGRSTSTFRRRPRRSRSRWSSTGPTALRSRPRSISWDSTAVLTPTIDRFDLANEAVGDTVTGPLGYDRHTLVIWARGVTGSAATYGFTYSGTSDPPGGIQFLDMGGDDPFYRYVGVLVDRGVVSGRETPAGSGLWFFNGKQNVLRAQFAKMIMEATELHTDGVENTGAPRFSDVPRLGCQRLSPGLCRGSGPSRIRHRHRLQRRPLQALRADQAEPLGAHDLARRGSGRQAPAGVPRQRAGLRRRAAVSSLLRRDHVGLHDRHHAGQHRRQRQALPLPQRTGHSQPGGRDDGQPTRLPGDTVKAPRVGSGAIPSFRFDLLIARVFYILPRSACGLRLSAGVAGVTSQSAGQSAGRGKPALTCSL